MSIFQKKDVVQTYDDRRFAGVGGAYIHMHEVLPVLQLLRKHSEVKTILDLGAGRGRLTAPLAEAGYDVDCLDFSDEMTAILKKNFPKATIFTQSIFDVIKTKTNYDCITGLRFFDHFKMSDQEKILTNVEDNIKKGGYLLIPTMNRSSLEYLFSKLFPYGRYNYFYTQQDYMELATKNNMRVVDSMTSFFIPRGFFLRFKDRAAVVSVLTALDRFFVRVFPGLGGYLYVLVKKK